MSKIIVIILIVIMLIYFYSGANSFSSDKIIVNEFKADQPGPTVCFIAGVHGNEPAGAHALLILTQMLNNREIRLLRGRIIVIPMANEWGLINGVRNFRPGFLGNNDLNRSFDENSATSAPIADSIVKIARNASLVMDFHEGWGYHQIQPDSIGSTISCTPHKLSSSLAQNAVKLLNSGIESSDKLFTFLPEMYCDIETTLACRCWNENIPYILMETTGQKEIQDRSIRVNQVLRVCEYTLKSLGMCK